MDAVRAEALDNIFANNPLDLAQKRTEILSSRLAGEEKSRHLSAALTARQSHSIAPDMPHTTPHGMSQVEFDAALEQRCSEAFAELDCGRRLAASLSARRRRVDAVRNELRREDAAASMREHEEALQRD